MDHNKINTDLLIDYACQNLEDAELFALEDHLNICNKCFEQSEGINKFVKHKILPNSTSNNSKELAQFAKQEYTKMLSNIHEKFEAQVGTLGKKKKDNVIPIHPEQAENFKSTVKEKENVFNMRRTFVALSMVASLALLIIVFAIQPTSGPIQIAEEDLPDIHATLRDESRVDSYSTRGVTSVNDAINNGIYLYDAENWEGSVDEFQLAISEPIAKYYLGLIQLQKKQKGLQNAEYYFNAVWEGNTEQEHLRIGSAYYLAQFAFKNEDYTLSQKYANYVLQNHPSKENWDLTKLLEEIDKKLK